MILVTGASGQLGRLVIKALLRSIAPSEVVAGVRSPEKVSDLAQAGVQIRTVDYDRAEALDAALSGVEKVLLISGNAVGRRVPQHGAVISAARKAGVRLLAYTSVLRAPTSALGVAPEHRETEALIKSSGLPCVLLRNGWYCENYLARAAGAVATGTLVGCAGEGRICAAARADYADGAAAVLTAPDQAGRVYELAGDEAFTLSSFTALLTRQLGKTISYKNLSEPEFKAALESNGVPAAYSGLIARSDAATSEGALFDQGHQLSGLIGRATTPIEAMIAEALRDGRLKRPT